MPWPSGADRPVVGFIGLGRMGTLLALNLCRAGFRVVAFDARAEPVESLVAAGATAAESVPGTAASCDVLVTALPGPVAVEAVMLGRSGALQALREGSIWVDASTSTAAVGRTVAREGRPRGIGVVDAPASGTADGAAGGALQLFAGGTAADVARVRPVLDAMAGAGGVTHVGPRGAGYTVGLCRSLLWLAQLAAGAEALVLGARAGVEVGMLRRALLDLAPADGPLGRGIDGVLGGDYGEATLELVTRDLGLVVDLGRELGVPLELGALVEQLHRRARVQYGAEAGERSGIRMLEEMVDVTLRPSRRTPATR